MIPERKKTGLDICMLLTGAFIPNKKRRIAAKAKTDPLKGLPEIHASAATEIRGRDSRADKTLFDGFHLIIRAAKIM